MLKAILKSIALVIIYFILVTISGFVLFLFGVDLENTGTLLKIALVEKIGKCLVTIICGYWLVSGFRQIIGKD